MSTIKIRYIDSSSRLERLKWAVKRSDKLNWVLFTLAVLAILVSAIDWTMVQALFSGL